MHGTNRLRLEDLAGLGGTPALLLMVLLLLVGACGGGASTADGAPADAPRGTSADASHFVIEGHEQASASPRVSVHLDPGRGEGLFSDGVLRYEVRMLPKPLEKDTLTVWIANVRSDTPLGRVEVTDRLDTPSIMVGVGRGLLKGYKRVESGHLVLEEIDGVLSFTFEAELESNSGLDKARRGKRVTVRGRVVAAGIPDPS